MAGGLEAKGERQAVNPSGSAAVPTLNGAYQPNTAPAYVRWDAMLAHGATAPRRCCWGALGVAQVLRLLRDELELTMALTGCAQLGDISPNCLALPLY